MAESEMEALFEKLRKEQVGLLSLCPYLSIVQVQVLPSKSGASGDHGRDKQSAPGAKSTGTSKGKASPKKSGTPRRKGNGKGNPKGEEKDSDKVKAESEGKVVGEEAQPRMGKGNRKSKGTNFKTESSDEEESVPSESESEGEGASDASSEDLSMQEGSLEDERDGSPARKNKTGNSRKSGSNKEEAVLGGKGHRILGRVGPDSRSKALSVLSSASLIMCRSTSMWQVPGPVKSVSEVVVTSGGMGALLCHSCTIKLQLLPSHHSRTYFSLYRTSSIVFGRQHKCQRPLVQLPGPWQKPLGTVCFKVSCFNVAVIDAPLPLLQGEHV